VFEVLEDRTTPSNANFPPGQFPSGNPVTFVGGVFSVDPAGNAETQTMVHRFPATGVGGLNAAESLTGVVNWTPTESD
jgi:hypothetical protein